MKAFPPYNKIIFIFCRSLELSSPTQTFWLFQRDCESDQEEENSTRRPRTRKRSSTSWEQQPATSVSVNDVPVAKQWLCTFLTHAYQLLLVIKDQLQYLFEWLSVKAAFSWVKATLFGDPQNLQIICCRLIAFCHFSFLFSCIRRYNWITVDRNWNTQHTHKNVGSFL